jgi:hypothetical protein
MSPKPPRLAKREPLQRRSDNKGPRNKQHYWPIAITAQPLAQIEDAMRNIREFLGGV